MNEIVLAEDILAAYLQGYFPMAHEDEDNQLYWHLPEKRGIIPLKKFHIPKNVCRAYKKHPFKIKMNTDFESCIRLCSDREETWISEEIIEIYCNLNRLGYSHSIEVWDKNKMIGGLYGIAIKNAFFGESMFSKVTNTSKFALIYLVDYLNKNNYQLLDCQYLNPHLLQFGAIEINHKKYMRLLKEATK